MDFKEFSQKKVESTSSSSILFKKFEKILTTHDIYISALWEESLSNQQNEIRFLNYKNNLTRLEYDINYIRMFSDDIDSLSCNYFKTFMCFTEKEYADYDLDVFKTLLIKYNQFSFIRISDSQMNMYYKDSEKTLEPSSEEVYFRISNATGMAINHLSLENNNIDAQFLGSDSNDIIYQKRKDFINVNS